VTVLVALALSVALTAPASPAAPRELGATPHFVFRGPEEAGYGFSRLLPEAEARFDRLCRRIDACRALPGPIEVILAEDPEQFAAQVGPGSPLVEWAAGVAWPAERRIVLKAHGTALFTLAETFDHEVSHVLVHALSGGAALPLWLVEGVAIWHAGEDLLQRLEPVHGAALTGHLVPLDELHAYFRDRGQKVALAYAESAHFVRWLERQGGGDTIPRILAGVRAGRPWREALAAVLGQPFEGLEAGWREELADHGSWLLFFRDGNLFFAPLALLMLIAAAVKVRRRRRRLRELAAEEAAQERWQAAPPSEPPPTLH
jgi:hypothetical protein